MATPLSVCKTLVIGLGSTGTRICNAIAERIVWELGDLSRAPWVRFLAIETDSGAASQHLSLPSTDFCPLTIQAQDFATLLNNTTDYDSLIRLSEWLDLSTVRKLSNSQVTSGAGNIRMVGRLAFLFPQNYRRVHQAVQRRLHELHQLTSTQAAERLGAPPGHAEPPTIQFARPGVLVVVAGTLCGGTCSGIVSDFGFFLRRLRQQGDQIVGIFTLPWPDLSHVQVPTAERFKKNAYHALVELNHYHLVGRPERANERPIQFPDGEANLREEPYDVPYLAMPRKPGADGESQLNRAIADRIFMNIFMPATLPDDALVNSVIVQGNGPAPSGGNGARVAQMGDALGRAHVFCTFGLASLEFPARQIIDACSRYLLGTTLSQWCARSIEPSLVQERLNGLGFTWDGILRSLRQVSEGDSLDQRLQQKLDEVLRHASRGNADEAKRSLDQLRNAFTGTWMGDESASLPPGLVPHLFQKNTDPAARALLARLEADMNQRLLDYEHGPAPFLAVLQSAIERLNEILATEEAPADPRAADQILDAIRAYQQCPLLGFVRLKRNAIRALAPKLAQALENEVRLRERQEALRVLRDRIRPHQPPEPGVVKRAVAFIQAARERLTHLKFRVEQFARHLQQTANALAGTMPQLNGLCLFEPGSLDPGTANGGTVNEIYRARLREHAGGLGLDWIHGRDRAAREIVPRWGLLGSEICSQDRARAPWLASPGDAQSPDTLIPAEIQQRLLAAARAPFEAVLQEDALKMWRQGTILTGAPEQHAREVAEKASPFLGVNEALARRGGRAPVDREARVIVRNSPDGDAFYEHAFNTLGNPKRLESHEAYRVVVMQEAFRFPLSGCPQIVEGGLQAAQCQDFPTFFTRKDVHWISLSEKEIERVEEAKQLVTLAVLLGILEPKGGALALRMRPAWPGDSGTRRLRLNVAGAAQQIAADIPDLDGWPLTGVAELLKARIAEQRRAFATGADGEGDVAFVRHLKDQAEQGVGATIPDWNQRSVGEEIVRFCASDAALYHAFVQIHSPDTSIINQAWKAKGDPLPNGGRAQQDGLYCRICGGFIGEDEQSAARQGWRCYVNPEHTLSPW